MPADELPKRENYNTSEEWLNALLGEPKYNGKCEHCQRPFGPYSNGGDLRAAMTQHRNWEHFTGDVLMNTRETANVDTSTHRVRAYRR